MLIISICFLDALFRISNLHNEILCYTYLNENDQRDKAFTKIQNDYAK